MVLEAVEAAVAAPPSAATVKFGIGRLNASRKVGVPNVSVSAMPRICMLLVAAFLFELCDPTYTLSETSHPVPQSKLVCILVVVRNSSDTHEPLMRDSPYRWDSKLHSEMHIARSAKLA